MSPTNVVLVDKGIVDKLMEMLIRFVRPVGSLGVNAGRRFANHRSRAVMITWAIGAGVW
jgi:hypothetical protein